MVTNSKIALNGDLISPYSISYRVDLASQSVLRAYKVSPSTVVSFAKRHGVLVPQLPEDFDWPIETGNSDSSV